ncbi:addiction module toxin, RelE/StbE family [Clostridia bacterium]|nr:addiction module toxin, RelE/StbE family [Clostridia bacterium]
MLKIVLRHQFKKDYKLMGKRGRDMGRIDRVMHKLVDQQQLPEKNQDHVLLGKYAGYRECHIAPDWLLIYKVAGNQIYFARTGSHSDLF